MLLVLIILTLLAFAIVQSMRLLASEDWSWIASACFGLAVGFQVLALARSTTHGT
jgi:hypothetical protein